MGILLSCNCLGTIAWLHHMNLNEMLGEKTRWELTEMLLTETTSNKAAVRPLTSQKYLEK